MMELIRSMKIMARTWLVLVALIMLAGLLLGLSPAEATLGQNVKIVYLHVALTRAGEIGLYAAGLIGLGLLAREVPALESWLAPTSRVGLGFYAAGFVVSTIAQKVIWGGISPAEPRMIAALNVLAAGAILQVLIVWIPDARVKRVLHALMGLIVAWAAFTAQNVLHPGSAIETSESAAIRLYNDSLLLLCVAAGAWIAWRAHRPSPGPEAVSATVTPD